jgi:hypothetical protein
MTASKPNHRESDRNPILPQRELFIGPPASYSGASADVVERFADAVREWANQPVPTESCRYWGVEFPGAGRANEKGRDASR